MTSIRSLSPSLCRGMTIAVLVAIVSLPAAAIRADPLLMRNQNPLLAPYGLPAPLPARLPAEGTGRVAATLNWANAARDESSDSYDFTIDGEVQEVTIRLEHAVGGRFSAFAELPWRHLSGGSLDSLVEDWHQILGLPLGGPRRHQPRNDLLIEYTENDALLLRLDDAGSGIADIPIGLGYQLAASDRRALAAWVTVKLPTGSAGNLTGSGATDAALSLSGDTWFADRWQLFAQVDAVWLGPGDILAGRQNDVAWSVLAGVSWNAWRTLELTVQLDANSKVFDVESTDLAGDAVLMVFGGSYRTAGGWRFDLGVSEDIEVGASPDAAFNLSVRRDF